MIDGINGIKVNPMQLLRLQKYPIKIDDNLIAIDNLEEGTLKIYEYSGGFLDITRLFADEINCSNFALVAEITINDADQQGNIGIEKIHCCYGYENLAAHMIHQAVNFVKFYECCKSVSVSENERESWFLHAGGVLADFHKRDSHYVYQIR